MNDELLNICRLNLMEENIIESSHSEDRETALKAIEFARRQNVNRMSPSVVSDDAIDKHNERNTASDGTYPCEITAR